MSRRQIKALILRYCAFPRSCHNSINNRTLNPLSKSAAKYLHTSSKIHCIYIRPTDDTPTIPYNGFYRCEALETKGNNPAGYVNLVQKAMKDIDKFPKDQMKLPARRMKDSFISVIFTPGRDESRETLVVENLSPYSSMLGVVDRFGAGLASAHLDIPSFNGQPLPYACITLMLDHIRLTDVPFKPETPMRISGHVSQTGRSKMEVDGEIEQKNSNGKYETVATCAFLMAARTPDMKSAAVVNQLVAGDDAERRYMQKIAHRAHMREIFLKDATSSLVPRIEHFEVMKQLESADKSKFVSIDSTKVVKVFDVKPENRNEAYIAFGGFTLSTAEATANAAAAKFSKSEVKLYHSGHGRYLRPVPIGNQFKCEAAVVAEVRNPHLLHVAVTGECLNPQTNKKEVATVFHFLYKIDEDVKVPFILPRDDYETRLKISGYRFIRFVHEPEKMYPNPYQS
jgi:acyl-CoA hydrolase